MNYNHPVKYALMPIIRKVGKKEGLYGLENIYHTDCYIVSKCYVIEEKRINPQQSSYEVFFPFMEKDSWDWKRTYPVYNSINGECINSFQTNQVFDTFEEASIIKDEKNDVIKREQYRNRFLSRVEEIALEKKFDAKMDYYNMLETVMSIETNDMIVDDCTKTNQK